MEHHQGFSKDQTHAGTRTGARYWRRRGSQAFAFLQAAASRCVDDHAWFGDAKPEGSFPNALGTPGLGQQTIFVYESKSPKGRRFVPISPRVRQALLARYSEQKEGWIFPSKRAGDGHLTTVSKQFEKARKEAGLPNDIVLYCARHGFGTEMYRATKILFAVMNVMGHTTVTTTMKYQHQNIDEVAAVASHRVQ